MADQATAIFNELKSREGRQHGPRGRSPNVFKGAAEYHCARIDDIDAVRLSVAPQGELLPQSMAIATVFDWEKTDAKSLPLIKDFQQSAAGSWEFFLDLEPGAACFGLGERFTGLNVRGKQHTLFTTDETKHTEFADALYKAIPFAIIQQQGQFFGVFLDSPAPQRWDLDSHLDGTATIQLLSRRGWELYVIGPGSLPNIVEAYTHLTGRPQLPPLWSLGHQQSRWSYPDEQTVLSVAEQFRKRRIPCDTIVLDIDYMNGYRVFTTSKERFPNFNTLASRLENQEFKLVTIVDPGVKRDPKYPVYNQAIEENLVCKTVEGQPFVEEVWPGECVFPDFERPDARRWWGEQHDFYVKNGIAGIWNDMNEPTFFNETVPSLDSMSEMPPMDDQPFVQRAPEGRVGHLEVRNRYGFLMCRATCEGLHELRPNERPFVLTRSAYAGIQRYAAVWLGDNFSWWNHLRMSIPMLLNIGLSGVAFAGVDVGGFSGDTSAELLTRWYETGIFYPFFRNHCRMGERPQEPWALGAEVESHIRRLIEMRYRLLPYIQGLFWEHHKTGAPLMRPLCWHYADDPVAADIDDQFLFGADIMVAPIVESGKTYRTVYFPAGRWYALDPVAAGDPSQDGTQHGTGGRKPASVTVYEGGRAHVVELPLGSVPAFVREGSIIPLAEIGQSTVGFDKREITFTIYGDNARGKFFEDDGHTNGYRQGDYNEWELSYEHGALTSHLTHSGFKFPERKYFVQHGTEKRPVHL